MKLTPRNDGMIELEGRTYAVKDKLKELGCVYDSIRRIWLAPANKAMIAQFYINNGPDQEYDKGVDE